MSGSSSSSGEMCFELQRAKVLRSDSRVVTHHEYRRSMLANEFRTRLVLSQNGYGKSKQMKIVLYMFNIIFLKYMTNVNKDTFGLDTIKITVDDVTYIY